MARRQDALWFDTLEPHIMTSDCVTLGNYLQGGDEPKGIVATFRSVHLKDLASFQKRLQQEKLRHLLAIDGKLNASKLQCFQIIEDMERDPQAAFDRVKGMQEKNNSSNLPGVTEEQIESFMRYFQHWPVNVRKVLLAGEAFFYLSPNGLAPSHLSLGDNSRHGQPLGFSENEGVIIDLDRIKTLRPTEREDLPMYAALYRVLGKGPATIDWKAADVEMQRQIADNEIQRLKLTPRKSQKDESAEIMPSVLDAVRRVIHKTNERSVKKALPRAFAAQSAYMGYMNATANNIVLLDPTKIERPDIPLLHDDNQPETNRLPNLDMPTAVEIAAARAASPAFDDLMGQAEAFTKQCLAEHPPINHFRCHLSLQSGHPVILTFTNEKNTDVREFSLMLRESNLEHALRSKQLIQSHLLNTLGVLPYRKPFVEGGYPIEREDFIPNQPPSQVRLVKLGGMFKVEMRFDDPSDPCQLGFSLGLRQEESNRAEAERRMNIVTEFLEEKRTAGQWITKSDAMDHLRAQIPAEQWQTAEKMPVEGYADNKEISIPFPDPASGQTTAIRVGHLHVGGDPNPAWRLPLQVIPNKGFPIGIDLNLHVLDESAAQQRASEVIQALMKSFKQLPGNAKWALDEKNMIARLSEAARAVSPDIDVVRLSDILRDLPHYKDDLAVRIVQRQEKGGETAFDLGIIRAANIGLNERVMEKIGDDPSPVPVSRHFSVQSANVGEIPFESAVNAAFQRYLQEEYRPRTNQAIESDGIPKRKASLAYQPKTAPLLLDDAIRTQMQRPENFPGITWTDSPKVSKGRGRWREAVGNTPGISDTPAAGL